MNGWFHSLFGTRCKASTLLKAKGTQIAKAGDYWCCTAGHRNFQFTEAVCSGDLIQIGLLIGVNRPDPKAGEALPSCYVCHRPLFGTHNRPTLIERI